MVIHLYLGESVPHECWCHRSEYTRRFPGARAIGSCELPDLSA